MIQLVTKWSRSQRLSQGGLSHNCVDCRGHRQVRKASFLMLIKAGEKRECVCVCV